MVKKFVLISLNESCSWMSKIRLSMNNETKESCPFNTIIKLPATKSAECAHHVNFLSDFIMLNIPTSPKGPCGE